MFSELYSQTPQFHHVPEGIWVDVPQVFGLSYGSERDVHAAVNLWILKFTVEKMASSMNKGLNCSVTTHINMLSSVNEK